MARELNLEVILAMADRFSGPARRVSLASKATSKAVKAAREQTRGLQSQMGEVRKLKRMEQALGSNGQALDDARRKLSGLANEQKRTGDTSKALSRRFNAAQREVTKLAAKQRGLKGDAAGVRSELRGQGVDTRKLGTAERRLGDRIDKVNKRLASQKKWLGRVGHASEVASGMLNRAFGVMKWGAAAAAGAGAAMVPFIRTAAQFEKYQATLETVEGSEAKAKKAMDWVSEFATTTPYQLDNVTQAYVKLRAYGLEPTGGLLRTLGDTSAAMGKDVMQSVEAIADAVTGENERLKEFGIRASKNGDKITYSYTDKEGIQRQMQVMKDDRKAIEKALRQIWDEKFAGGMERQSKTMGGLWSNLMDQWTRFQQMVMKSGPFERIKQRLKEVLDRINQMARNGELEALAERVGAQMLRLIDGAWKAGKKLWEMGQVAFDVTSRIAGLVGGWENLAFVLIGLKILPTVMMLGKLGGVLWWVGATVLPVVGKAALVLGRALLLNPVGLVLTGIAIAAYQVYKHWDTVSGWLSTAWDALVGMAGRIWGRIKEAFSGGIGGVSALLVDWSPMGLLWRGISAGLAKLGIDLPASLSGLGKSAINGLIDGLFSMLAAVKATIGNIASGVVNWFKDKLGIASPSKVFAGFGGNLIEGLINGITAKWSALKTKITETAGGVVSWFKDKLGIASPSKVFAGFGGNLIEGLINGITAKWSALKTKITETAGGVVSWFKDKLGIASPSKVFASIGDDTMAGMAMGLDRSAREPVRKIDALNRRLRRQAAGITIAASAGMAGGAGPAAAGGGMERQSKTMGGLWSNLMDQWTRFQQMVMKSGPFERIKQRLKEVLDRINQMAGNGKLEALAERVGAQMLRLIDGAWKAGKKLWEMGQVAFDVTSRIAGLVGGWENLAFVLIGLKILPTVMMLGKLGVVLWWVGATVLPVVGKAALVLGRALLLNPVGLVLTGIAIAAYQVYKHWDTVSGWLSTAWDALVGMAGRIWGRIKEAFSGGIGGVSALLVDWSPMGLLWRGISAGLDKLGIDLPASLSGLGKSAINGLIDGLFSMLAAVKATIGNIASGVVNWFKDKLGIASPSKVFAGFGGNLIEGLINGITAKWSALKTKITETAGGVVSWFKDKLGIASPSKVFASIGDDTMAGMAMGLDRSAREPVRKIDALNRRLRRQAAGITIAASAGMAGGAGPAAAGGGMANAPIEINITINAAPGQDAEAIGRAAARQTADALRGRTGGALYDED